MKEVLLNFFNFYFFSHDPTGIEILTEIPQGQPQNIPPTKIPAKNSEDLSSMMEQLQEPSVTWWHEWLQNSPLPTYIIPEGNFNVDYYLPLRIFR